MPTSAPFCRCISACLPKPISTHAQRTEKVTDVLTARPELTEQTPPSPDPPALPSLDPPRQPLHTPAPASAVITASVHGLVDALGMVAAQTPGATDTLREAGAIDHLVSLCGAGLGTQLDGQLARTLGALAVGCPENAAAICAAGGVGRLVGLLEVAAAANDGEGAGAAASALWALASEGAGGVGDAIREIGGVARLVAVLSHCAGGGEDAALGGGSSAATSPPAADPRATSAALLVLEFLALDPANSAPICEAGGVEALVEALERARGPESELAASVGATIWHLAASLDEGVCHVICATRAAELLVPLLACAPESAAAESAAGALWCLSVDHSDVVSDAGALEPLRSLERTGGAAAAAQYARSALTNIATLPARRSSARSSRASSTRPSSAAKPPAPQEVDQACL